MAFLYRGVGTASNGNNSTSRTPGLPSGVVAGDLLVVQFQSFGGTNSRVPSISGDWTSYVWNNGTAHHLLAWKIAGESESTPTITLTGTGATNDTQVSRCFAFYTDAVNKQIALSVAGTDSTNASADNIGPISGVTVPTGGGLTLVSAGKTNDFNGQGSLSNWTQAALTESTTGNDAGMSLLYRLATPAGATGGLTVNDSGGTNSLGLGFGKVLCFVEEDIPGATGTGTASFGLDADATGTAAAPSYSGTATALFGLALAATAAFTPAPVTGTGTAAFGLEASSAGTVVNPIVTGSGTAAFGLTVSSTGTLPVTPTHRATRVSAHLLVQGEGGVGSRITRSSIHALVQGEGGVGARVSRVSLHILEPQAALEATDAPASVNAEETLAPVEFEAIFDGVLDTSFNGDVIVERDDPSMPEISGTTTRTAVDGVVVFDDLVAADQGELVIRGRAVGGGRAPGRTPPINVRPRRRTGTATALFALDASATGTVAPPPVTGSGSASIGLASSSDGTVGPPSSSGSGTAAIGLLVQADGTAIPPAYSGDADAAFGLLVIASGAPGVPAFTGTGTAAFGLDVDADGTATPPAYTGTATAPFGLRVDASGSFGVPIYTGDGSALVGLAVVASGTAAPPAYSGSALLPFGLQVSASGAAVPPPVAGTGTASFGLVTASSGDVAPPGAVTGSATVPFGLLAAAIGSSTIPPVDGTASALLGVAVASSGTAVPPQIDGSGTATIGLDAAAAGTVNEPVYAGTGVAHVGLTALGVGTVVNPGFTGGAVVTFGLRVRATDDPRALASGAAVVSVQATPARVDSAEPAAPAVSASAVPGSVASSGVDATLLANPRYTPWVSVTPLEE